MNESMIFAAASKKKSTAERDAYLEGACGNDAGLRQQVEELLRLKDEEQSFLEQPAARLEPTVDVPPGKWIDPKSLFIELEDEPGTLIGHYKLLQKIGEGGMGTVWMAEQQQPVRRMIALKLVKAGIDSDKVVARFEAERQALALMDHPNIARIYDAGIVGQRPYFVMELVKGTPITKYCDDHRLAPKERLELFTAVCQAIQHAHQKGIIHRDIKPSNILVAPYDGRPVVKVIDFGVAKATGQRLTDKTMYTEFGAIVGTLEYMSPEQAELNNQDIDTRSDIYALGVLLYELLTGSTPLNRKRLKAEAMLEMLRMIREQEPPKPSTRLSTDDALPSISAQRRTDPAKLSKLLRGELDWIVMKALEKDRNRRYETANGFGLDIQRYLAGDAVLACPPSATYRFRKFLKRNKGPVLAASLLLFALLAGIAGTTLGLIEAKKQKRLAEERRQEAEIAQKQALQLASAEREAKKHAEDEKANALKAAAAEKTAKLDAEAKRKEAERNLAFARKGNEILGSVFADLNPQANYSSVAELRNALRDNLNKAVKELEGTAIGEPMAVANMQCRLGMSLLNLGEANLAIDVLSKAYTTCKQHLGTDHPITLITMNGLALGYKAAGDMKKALPLLEKTFERTTAKLGAEHPHTLSAMNDLALGYLAVGKMDKALPLFEETFKLRSAKLGADHPDTLWSMENLAAGYQAVGNMDKALPLFEETLKLMIAKMGADHPNTLRSMNSLAEVYKAVGKMNKALPLLEETLKLKTAKLGADNRETLTCMNSLALCYQAVGKMDKALPLMEETLKLSIAKLGADHPDTLVFMNSLAMGYQSVRRMDQALPLFEETLKLQTAKWGINHSQTLISMNNLATAYKTVGKTDQAISLQEKSLKLMIANLGAGHPDTLISMNNLALNYMGVGKMDCALSLFEKAAIGIEQRHFQHQYSENIISSTIAAYEQAQQFDKAEAWRRKWLSVVKADSGADSPVYAGHLALLGSLLLKQQKWAEAEPVLRESLAIREKVKPDDWVTFHAQSKLGGALLGQKKFAEAEPLLLQGYEGMKQREKSIPQVPQTATRLPEAVDRLIELYKATNQPAEVKKWQAERAKYKETAPLPKAVK